jgi:hypothetical protein
MTDICFNTTHISCAAIYKIFSIETANPSYFTIGDGYFGLAPKALQAMARVGMISKA